MLWLEFLPTAPLLHRHHVLSFGPWAQRGLLWTEAASAIANPFLTHIVVLVLVAIVVRTRHRDPSDIDDVCVGGVGVEPEESARRRRQSRY